MVRDLAWALDERHDLLLTLPPFQRLGWPHPPTTLAPWLSGLDQKPDTLATYLAARNNQRLGNYFENLLDFYFHESPDSPFEVHGRNLALRNPTPEDQRGSTLGELDFLLRQAGEWMHLEVAVKFYLGVADGAGELWLGPNNRDRWDRKIAHLRDHQLPISQQMPLTHFTGNPLQRYFCVKGYLFHPWPDTLPLPSGTQDPEVNCWWIRCREISTFLNSEHATWRLLERREWLGGTAGPTHSGESVTALVQAHFQTSSRALMLSRPTPENHNGQRLLVVADCWPTAH